MIDLCVVLFLVCLYVCVCECLLQNNMRMYTSINIHRSEVHCGSAVRFGQALPGLLITAPPSVCVSAVLSALVVWIQNQKKVAKGHTPEVVGRHRSIIRIYAQQTSSTRCSFVLTLFIFKAPNYMLAQTLTERVV